jgi:hypothetical protein
MTDPEEYKRVLKDLESLAEVVTALVESNNHTVKSVTEMTDSLYMLGTRMMEQKSDNEGVKNLLFAGLGPLGMDPGTEEYLNLTAKVDTLYLIGSGPSLNKVDVSSLKDSATLSLNRSYVAWPDWGFAPTFYVAIERRLSGCYASSYYRDNKVTHPYLADWKDMLADQNNKFLPQFMFINQESPLIRRGVSKDNCHLVDAVLERGITFFRVMPGLGGYSSGHLMSTFKEGGILGRHKGGPLPKIAGLPLPMQQNGGAYSVILAYMMGVKRVVLLGIDANYSGRQESIDKGEDVEHFHPDYFDPARFIEGKTQGSPDDWHSAKPWQMIKDANLPDFEIISSSPGSKINNIFEYRDLQDLLKEDKERKQNEQD